MKHIFRKPHDRTSSASQPIPDEPQERPWDKTTAEGPEVSKLDSPWHEAYKKLVENDPKLIHAYENGLLQAWQPEETGDIVEEDFASKLIPLIKNRLEVINQFRAKIVIGNKDIVVREKLGQVVDLVISAKDLISAAISPEPHAAIAWAGVLLVLGPVVKALKKEDEAVEGFTQISHILVRYRVLESEIFPDNRNAGVSLTGPRRELMKNIRDQTIELYTAILGYQIRLATHFSKSGLWRAFDDLGGSDDWKSKLQEIKEIDQRIQAGLTDNDRGVVDNRLSKLQANMQKGLELLVTTEDVAQVRFRSDILTNCFTKIAKDKFSNNTPQYTSNCS